MNGKKRIEDENTNKFCSLDHNGWSADVEIPDWPLPLFSPLSFSLPLGFNLMGWKSSWLLINVALEWFRNINTDSGTLIPALNVGLLMSPRELWLCVLLFTHEHILYALINLINYKSSTVNQQNVIVTITIIVTEVENITAL